MLEPIRSMVLLSARKKAMDYGMRHVEKYLARNRAGMVNWIYNTVHGCPTSSAHYKSMMGQHINKVTYYTSKGIYTIPVNDIFCSNKI